MAKLKQLLAAISFLTTFCAGAQSYTVHYHADSNAMRQAALRDKFSSRAEATSYIFQLPSFLQTKGYTSASIDSVHYDSLNAQVFLYLGEQYRLTNIRVDREGQAILDALRWDAKTMDLAVVNSWQQKILDHLEDNGYPFGKVYLDSISINGNELNGVLRIEQGPLYRIDSIRVHGNAKVSNEFLQRYLDIPDGSIYSRKKLSGISKKLAEVTYLQEEKPATLDMLATGSVLNLYLKARKTNQVNALIGFLPNSDQLQDGKKFLLTVDANILLRNALGSGETIGFVWQQLQQQSPRLNLLFDQPYAFRSPFGINFTLDMYKRDSTFLNINMNLGSNYRISEKKTATLFLQRRQTIVNGINTMAVLQSRILPREGDVSSLNLGVGYSFVNTDYRFNPSKGNEVSITSSAGTKRIRKNNQVLELKDPSDPGFKFETLYDTVKLKAYQFRVTGTASQYFPLGGQSTLKLGLNGGIYQSANYFRNELFQIGGFRLLRGFDEESQFVSRYALGTVEYRLRTGMNSFFFAFVDGGFGRHQLEAEPAHSYLGTGLGLSFETKTGIINFAGALGKRDDTDLNLRQVKLHLGFASYF